MRQLSLALAISLLSLPLSAADDWGDDEWAEEATSSVWHGFVESAVGTRLQSDPIVADDDYTLAEARVRLETERYLGETRFSLKGDIFSDGVEGGTQVDMREALLDINLGEKLDLRLGHQVLTWGTGDLLFLNDLFAKDWQSFFSGRDDEYLKAASTSIRLSAYGEKVNAELVWTPVFTSDRFIEGERFSYFSPLAGQQVAAPAAKVIPVEPKESLRNGELAARLYGNADLNGSLAEWALYAYHGYWKQPNSLNAIGQPVFTPLNVLGASIRGAVGRGLGNAEFAWYNGTDDQGNNPHIPNNQLRVLLGYETELRPRLTLGLQYYLEHIQDYSALAANDAGSPYRPDRNRQLWTVRLNYRMWQDNLTLSWFSFWSPTDQDSFHRPAVRYRFNDQLNLTLGANIFSGKQGHTFFGQFEDASNLYARLRWSY